MRNKTENPLPKMMSGSVHTQYVRCGKGTCKCTRGELHGAYYYHFVRVGGRLRKRYLKAHEVEQMRIACNVRREEERGRRVRLRESVRLIRAVTVRLRGVLKQGDFFTGD